MNNYDKYPETRVTGHDDDAWEGAETVAAKLAELSSLSDHTLVVECYPGVDDEVLELMRSAFRPDVVVLSDDAFYDGDELAARMQPHLTDDRVRGVMYYGRLEDFVDSAALEVAQARLPGHGRTLVYGVGAGLVATGDTFVYCDLARWEIELRYRAGMHNFRAHNEDEDVLRKVKRGYFVEWRIADKRKMEVFDRVDFSSTQTWLVRPGWDGRRRSRRSARGGLRSLPPGALLRPRCLGRPVDEGCLRA